MLDAAIAAIKAGRTGARVYEINKVPADPTYPYSVVKVVSRRPFGYTLDATHGLRDYEVTVASYGTTDDAVSDYDDAASDRLLDQTLTVAGFDCNPCQWVTSRKFRDPDDRGVIDAVTVYEFSASKESA